jgi:TPR repeat protein
MNRLLILPVLLLTLLVGTPASSADFQKGLDAYNRADFKSALIEWRTLAESGDKHSQYFLGLLHDTGRGVPRDINVAIKWYKLAAEQGSEDAQNALRYLSKKRQQIALERERQLAKQGNADAQYNLGVMYNEGQGVPEDDNAAFKWYTLAAEQGNAGAQVILGLIYDNGRGVPQDDKTAVKWYTLAAEQGDVYSQYNLGVMYEGGWGVPKDDKTAVKWYRLAAKQGNANAQYNLGWMYEEGQGVPKDNVYAYMWWDIAASSGDKDAISGRDVISKRMTPADISAAQKLARECVRKKYKGC